MQSNKIDLREKNKCSNCSNTNLTEFSTELLKSDEVYLENSNLNKTIYTSINEEGILQSVIENEISIMKNEKTLGEDPLDSINKV